MLEIKYNEAEDISKLSIQGDAITLGIETCDLSGRLAEAHKFLAWALIEGVINAKGKDFILAYLKEREEFNKEEKVKAPEKKVVKEEKKTTKTDKKETKAEKGFEKLLKELEKMLGSIADE